MRTPFVSPFRFGGALTDPPWSLSGETARMSITVSPGSAMFYYRQEKSGNGEKGFAERQVALGRDFTSIQSEANNDYEEMTELIISLAKKRCGFLWCRVSSK